MKPERVYLDELYANTKSYKVKVKVIEKGRPKTSPKKVVYQSVLLQDDKGNRIRGALFGDQVEGYKDAFVYNGVYEIANAPIKTCEPQWKSNPNDLDFQMSFGSNTVIQPIDTTSTVVLPEYQNLAQILKTVSGEEKFDVLGVIIYIEDSPRKIITSPNRESYVRELLIVDNSVNQPVIISAWNDLAETECDTLAPAAQTYNVVGFTAMRVLSYKGFSLATIMSTTFDKNPAGNRANNLREWAQKNTTCWPT
ncbi:hypothetical protein RND81_03G113600 [Saponaria officinalis]|uniref:Replication protein A OB domain-containing protein n=1 Tax=Saponaria officinalis TaxID=3572 RepID=A0AAW1M7W8_SAPOF